MLINHIDLKLLKEKAPEDFDYYNKLNSFFSFLEKKLNFDVVIALHPRSNLKKSKKLFNNRKCKINLTAELVKKSEFVCMHASTSSISFPILLKKKILILNSNNIMKNFNYRFRFEIIKKYINLRNINLDNYNNYENDLRLFINTKIKHKQYINYRNKFLGPLNSKNLNFSDICLSKLI